jgi:hypothetical protein
VCTFYGAPQNGVWLLEAKGRAADALAAFCPKFGESLEIGANFVGLVNEQFAARLVTIETNQGMPLIDQNHAVPQVGELFRRCLQACAVAVETQQIQEPWLSFANRRRIPHGYLHCIPCARFGAGFRAD